MLPSNKRWLPATSASHSRDGAASSSTDPSAWALSEPGSVCSQLGERAAALLLLQPLQGLGIVHFFQSNPLPGKTGTPSTPGLGCSTVAPCCRQQSRQQSQPGLHSIGSSSFTWQRAPCCPSSSTSSWQEPAPSSRSTLGKTRALPWCVPESSQQTCFPSLTFPCLDPLAASVPGPEGSGQLSCR